jgi:hypothetical protein
MSLLANDKVDVIASLCFYSPPADGRPPRFQETHENGTGIKNYAHARELATIGDIRGKEGQFALESNGFAAFTWLCPSIDFDEERAIVETYYPSIKELLLANCHGAHSITIFDHTIRQAAVTSSTEPRPVHKMHIDQTPYAAKLRAFRHLKKEEARRCLSGSERLRIVNVWKPLHNTVKDNPLALVDVSTVIQEDLVPVEHVFPDRVGETFAVKFSDAQRFWYWSDMTTTEVLLIQCFDSGFRQESNWAEHPTGCPHASFQPPHVQSMTRSSIEVRCIVLG